MIHLLRVSLVFIAGLVLAVADLPNPVICEDSLDGQPPFNENATPCLVGCPAPMSNPADIAKYGTYNATDIPYCKLRCLISDASASEVAAAPGCSDKCSKFNNGTPENQGWCMWWCLKGGELANEVVSTSCVPNRVLTTFPPRLTTDIDVTLTIQGGFETPAAWIAWYKTQTVISRDPQLLSAFATQTTATSSSTAMNTPSTSSSGTGTTVVQAAENGSNTATLAATTSHSGVFGGEVSSASWVVKFAGLVALFI